MKQLIRCAWVVILFSCNDNSSNQHIAPVETLVVSKESGEHQINRAQWIESMHKAAPGTDWRAIEAQNLRRKVKRLKSIPSRRKSGEIEDFANGSVRGEWSERGPSNQAGNIKATLHDPSDNRIFMLSGGGTLFKGNIDGNGWQVINQDLKFNDDYLTWVSYNNAPRLIAKAERIPHYSDDGGYTWTKSSGINIEDQTWGRTELIVSEPTTNHVIFALSKKDYWDGYRIYRSQDGGESFQRIKSLTSNEPDRFSLFKTRNTDDIYFVERSALGTLSLSKYDFNTASFVIVNADFLSEQAEKIVLNPTSIRLSDGTNRHYFYNSDNEIILTTDNGANVFVTGTMPASPWGLIYASAVDPDLLLMGEVDAYRSEDSGATWTQVNGWAEYYGDEVNKLHADIMSFNEIELNDGTQVILTGHHGGLSVSEDGVVTNTNITLQAPSTAQFYDVRTDPTNSEIIYAGSQDQGFQRSNGVDNNDIQQFDQLVSGDYGKIAFTNDNQSLWTVYPGGDIAYFQNALTSPWPTDWYEINSTNESVWLPPLVANPDPSKNEIFIAGGDINGGESTHLIRAAYTNEIQVDQFSFDFNPDANGQLTAVGVSVIDDQLILVGTSEGAIFRTLDGGENWDRGGSNIPNGNYLYGAAILTSTTDENVVYVGGSGYSNPGVLRSGNKGNSFFDMSNGLPPTTVFDMDMTAEGDLIFAATEAGPYVYVVEDEKWYDINGTNAPYQTYWSVEYIQAEGIVRFGTYGRGVWDFDIERQVNVSTNQVATLEGVFEVYPNPSTGIFNLHIEPHSEGFYNPSYSIFDMTGSLIKKDALPKTSSTTPMNLTHLPPGNYQLTIEDQGRIYTKKLLKQ